MFIVNTKKGITYNENQEIEDPKLAGHKRGLTWDDLPNKIRIASLTLVYPFPVIFKKADGTTTKPFSPKLTIKNFNRYYFFNESTLPIMVQGEKVVREGVSTLEAKTIAGIDDKAKLVMEFRMDKFGNCSVSKSNLSRLDALIKSGTFREEIIRFGDFGSNH